MAVDYKYLLQNSEITLKDVPRKEKSHSVCLSAVRINGLDLYHVPKHFRTDVVCYSAVFQNAKAILLLNDEYLTSNLDVVSMAISRNYRIFIEMKNNRPKLINEELCMSAVRASGSVLAYVPDEFISDDIVRVALQNDSSALRDIRIMKNEVVSKIIDDIIPKIPLKHVPDHLMTYKICLNQVAKQGRQLQHVPLHLIDLEMIEAALKHNEWAIEFVPVTFKDEDCVLKYMQDVPDHLVEHLTDIQYVS
jgi:hypothetical protein